MDNCTRKDCSCGLKSTEMLGMPRKRSYQYAKLLMDGKLVVNWSTSMDVPFSAANIDWNISDVPSSNTFQLFLQALNPVAFLVGGFVGSRDLSMYHLAGSFVESWIQFCPKEILIQLGNYVWDQHAAALRTEALLYYYLIGKENHLLSDHQIDMLMKVLNAHGDYLSDQQYYLPNENHGVFMDRALLYLGCAFKREDWCQLAVERLWSQWQFLFGENGVCVENSITYQHINRSLFLEISHFLKQKRQDEVSLWLLKGLKKAENFIAFALLPDGSSPPFGDSLRSDYLNMTVLDPNGHLAYATGSNKNAVPKDTSVIYFDEGYYFGREFWKGHEERGRALEVKDSVWTMLRSGYKSLTHRQADDNSFMLYARGHAVFTDAGCYNYMYRDPVRQYVRSANAHNSVIVDGESYDYLRSDCMGMSGIFYHHLDRIHNCDYVAAFNQLYRGVMHIRHFLYFKTDVLLIDELYSDTEHTYSQMFHCGKNIQKLQADVSNVQLGIDESGYQLVLHQHQHCDNLETFYGEKEGILYGNISEQIEQLHAVNTLKFNKKGNNAVFVTQLSLADNAGVSLSGLQLSVDLKTRCVQFRDNGNTQTICKLQNADDYALGKSFALPIDKTEINCKDNVVEIKNANQYAHPVKYAWYLLEADGKTQKLTQWYSDDSAFTIHFDETKLLKPDEGAPGLIVRAFVQDMKTNDKASQDVASIYVENGILRAKSILKYTKKLQEWGPKDGG